MYFTNDFCMGHRSRVASTRSFARSSLRSDVVVFLKTKQEFNRL